MTIPIRLDIAKDPPADYVHCRVTVDGDAVWAACLADEQAGLVIEPVRDDRGCVIADGYAPYGFVTRERRGVVRIEPTERNPCTRADLEARYAIG